jgi:hypothetical protein
VEHLEFQIVSENQGKYFLCGRNGALLEIIPGKGETDVPGMMDLGGRHVALLVADFEAACGYLRRPNLEFLSDSITIPALDLRVIFSRTCAATSFISFSEA